MMQVFATVLLVLCVAAADVRADLVTPGAGPKFAQTATIPGTQGATIPSNWGGTTPGTTGGTPRADVPEDPRTHLEHILEQPLYQRWKLRQEREQVELSKETQNSWVREFIKNFIESIAKAIGDFFRWLARKISMPNLPNVGANLDTVMAIMRVAGWIALGIVTLFLLVVAYRWGMKYWRAQERGRVLSREQVRRALEQGEALELESPQWLEEAARLAKEGDQRAVYRALYLALLSGLHERGKIEFRKNRTNWIYVQRFAGPETERGVFGELTQWFDDAWYGLRMPEGMDFPGVRQRVANLVGESKAGAK